MHKFAMFVELGRAVLAKIISEIRCQGCTLEAPKSEIEADFVAKTAIWIATSLALAWRHSRG